MVARSRIEKLEQDIDYLHRRRIIPPLEAALRELPTEKLREILAKLEKLENFHD